MRGSPQPTKPGAAMIVAAVFGLATGLGEVGHAVMRKYVRELFTFRPADALWMTPTADAIVFASMALLWVGIHAVRGRGVTQAQIVGLGAGLGVLSLLLLLPPIHPAASVLLGLGVAVQAARLKVAGHPALSRLAHRIALWSVPVLLGTAITVRALPIAQERKALAELPGPPAASANLLLIILDTVRALNLSVYGYGRPTTPGLERWAARGVRFANAQSTAPWTLPSHASLFTGREAYELSTNWYVPLDGRYPTLAEYLSSHGYLTAGFIANLPYASREVGLARGFHRYEDWPLSVGQVLVSSMLVRAVTENQRLRDLIGTHELVVRKRAPDINRSLLRWLDQHGKRPFFAFLNYYDAHTPFVPPEPFRSRFAALGEPFRPELARRKREEVPWDPDQIRGAMNAYDGAIAFLDSEIEALFRQLDRRGILSNTVVMVTSDHGEEFAEHGLFSHGNSLYLPALHVPLLVWYPGRVPAGRVVPTPVSIRDIPATVVDLLGLAKGSPFPGRSLTRFWQTDSAPAADLIYTEVRRAPKLPAWYPSTKGDLRGVQEGTLRFIRNGDGSAEVYDIAVDPFERSNRVAEPGLREQVERLRRLAEQARPVRSAVRPR